MSFGIIAGAWANRIIEPIAIFIAICIIQKELKKRKNSDKEDIYQKALNWSSLTAMIFMTMQLIIWFLHKLPVICLFTYRMMMTFYMLGINSVLLFQSIRLQYCFSSKRVHSSFGYPKCTFLLIYIFIAIVYIYVIGVLWLALDVYDHGIYGCEFLWSDNYLWVISVYIIMTLGMALTTFLCYVVKLCQIKKKSKSIDQRIIDRINYILSKILTLYILYCVTSLFMIIFTTLILSVFKGFDYSSLALTILGTMEHLMAIYGVYLMIERNDEEYNRFVKKWRIDLVCCCLYKPDEKTDQKTKVEVKCMETSIYNTKTLDIPKRISLKNASIASEFQREIDDK